MILLGTDVLVDVALDREPYGEAATALLQELERRPKTAFISWHTISAFYSLVAPAYGRKDARHFLLELTTFVEIAPTDRESFRGAALLPFPDFEDALQVAAARACGAACIATRNVSDFRGSPVPARTPAELLAEMT